MKLEELQQKIATAKESVLDAQAIIDSRPAKYALGFDIPAGVVTRDYQRLHHAKNELKELTDLLAIRFPKQAPLTEKQKIRQEQRDDMLRAAELKLEAAKANEKAAQIAREARIEIEKLKADRNDKKQRELIGRLRAFVGDEVFLPMAESVNSEYD
jgi:hypothetical protein